MILNYPTQLFTYLLGTFLLSITLSVSAESQLPADQALTQYYKQSIEDAAVIEPDEVKAVAPITKERARFVTWTSYPDSYVPGSEVTLGWSETWVTQDGAVQSACRAFPQESAALYTHIQQLLGLPPKANEQRHFIVLEVDTRDMFRPCANPSLAATECSANFGEGVSESHQAWYARQSAVAYQAPNGYPWTRLGYTYDWNPATDEEGVFEFVIKQGATVNVISSTPTQAYCQ